MSLWRKISSVAGTGQRELVVEAVEADIKETDRSVVSEIARALVLESELVTAAEGNGVAAHINVAQQQPLVVLKADKPWAVAVEAGVRVSGDLYLNGDFQIGGCFSGRIFATKAVRFLSGSVAEGHCEAEDAEVSGRFQGGLVCSRSILLKSGADISGSIRAPLLTVDDGAEVDCACSVGVGT